MFVKELFKLNFNLIKIAILVLDFINKIFSIYIGFFIIKELI